MKASRTAWVGVFGVAALTCCTLIGSACDHSESSTGAGAGDVEERIVRVSVREVRPVSLRDVLVLPGETEAWQDVRLAAETSGALEWIGPREGDRVRGGEQVARIDVSVLKATLDRAEAAFGLADALYQRRKRLFERKIINQEALDHSWTERVLAQGNLTQARVEYERGFIRAPISGVINELFVDAGEFINRGQAVADIVDVDKIKINLNVPEMDVRYIEPGEDARVRVDAFPKRELAGTVDFVAFKADPATKTFSVRVLMDNPGHEIRPGMIARVSLVRQVIPDALVAPLFAVVDKGGERLVFVEEDGTAQARTVRIGVIDGDRVEITEGIQPGDRLIVTGQTEVEEGTRVQVR